MSGFLFLSMTNTRALPLGCPCGRDAPGLAISEAPLGNGAGRPVARARFVSDPTCLLRVLGEVRAEEAP